MGFIQFPERFEWGAATAAYQIEGAPDEDGKGPSIWDTFCREKGRVQGGQTGDRACDHYHHLLLSHGLAVQAFRACGGSGEIGITHADTSYEPLDDTSQSAEALERARDFGTRLWHGPVLGRGYPQTVSEYYASKGAPLPVEPGDLERISTPIDFLGVNLYSRAVVRRDTRRGVGFRECDPTLPTTAMGYEIAPHALGDFVRFVSREYGRPRIYITENGMCDNTPLVAGVCDDQPRISLLRGMLAGLGKVLLEGEADVGAYYVWSLLDNFEWAYGDSKRFGIVWTDYETLERTPKASARFFSEVIRRNGVET
ncbi:MAG: family 1 glycosylhydrolase [Myxococcota bacterium]